MPCALLRRQRVGVSDARWILLLFCIPLRAAVGERPELKPRQAGYEDVPSAAGSAEGDLGSPLGALAPSSISSQRERPARARFHTRSRGSSRQRLDSRDRRLARTGDTGVIVSSRGKLPRSRLMAPRHTGANLQIASRRDVPMSARATETIGDAGDPGEGLVKNSSAVSKDSNADAALGVATAAMGGNATAAYVLMMAGPTEKPQTWTETFFALGSGTGAGAGVVPGRPIDWKLNQELALRMRCQDEAVLCLLVLVYLLTLGLSASLALKQSSNSSPVTYYADPRTFSSVMEGTNVRDFLENFNNPPKDVQMQVTGFLLTSEDIPGSVEWRDEHYSVAFTFALDLTPWVVRETLDSIGTRGTAEPTALSDGAVEEDVQQLVDFLARNENDLAMVEVHKGISWQNWEDLATNIKQQIRQLGFHGVISITKTNSEVIPVYKNKQWANFMHSRTIKVLCALSMFGWVFYVPYMWLRTTRLRVRSFFRVSISINDYWPLIENSLSAYGFLYHDD